MSEAFGPDLPQKREVVTAIPGPKSQELAQRRKTAVSAALGAVGCSFVGKLFMGATFEEARNHLRERFAKVKVIRPEGTRRCSVETFLVGMGRK
mgnify:CR=1 FL=1